MTKAIIPRAEYHDNGLLGDQTDALKHLFGQALRGFMEADVEQRVGAQRYERGEGRMDQRNGTRTRRFDTRMGSIDLEVPRLRSGPYMPAFLENYTRCERALTAVVQEAILTCWQRDKTDPVSAF